MKKIIFSSMIAAAVLFSGCGSSGDSGTTDPGTTDPGTTDPGTDTPVPTTKTYTPFTYAGTIDGINTQIDVNADQTWTIANDTRALGDISAEGMGYAAAETWCADKNQTLPSANDLLSLAEPEGISAVWAKGQFIAIYTDHTIGQSASEDANTDLKIVQCMTGDSIEKKHTITVNADESITDSVTGLSWSPFKAYDPGMDGNHTNQYRFPISNAAEGLLTAEQYCETLGDEWSVPTLGELRTITYLDGTTPVKVVNVDTTPAPIGTPTVLWTSTQNADGKNYVINLTKNSTHAAEDGDEVTNPGNASFYLTCVKQ